jgi:hypothetical protein
VIDHRAVSFYEPSPAWRWHGLGMLQREMSETLRVHVWHPDLVKVPPGLRRVHDHRFDLRSLVLIGSLVDKWYDVFVGAPDANTKIWSIKHAKIQKGASAKPGTHPTGGDDEPDVDLIGSARADRTATFTRRAGELYEIPRGAFHESEPTGLVITLVGRHNFAPGVSARVLGDHAHSAIAGQHHAYERDEAVVERVLAIAARAVGDAA